MEFIKYSRRSIDPFARAKYFFSNIHNRRGLRDDGRRRKKRRGQVTGHEYRNYYGQP